MLALYVCSSAPCPQVVDGVHARHSSIFLQFWAIGREADPDMLAALDPSYPYISASGIPITGSAKTPRAITLEEIKEYVRLHADAAKAAVLEAGFDGVEVDVGGGYLLDEFMKSFSNTRTDEYGGCPQNQARFALEVIDAVVREVGADRVGMKLTPWDTLRGGVDSGAFSSGHHISQRSRRSPSTHCR